MSKRTQVSAHSVLERAIAEETAALRKALVGRDAEVKRLKGLLAKIGAMCSSIDGAVALSEAIREVKAEDDFGSGIPPDKRPQAILPEVPSTGEAVDLAPGDNFAAEEGRWV